MGPVDSTFYVTGGTLRPDAPSYVERLADRELLGGLLHGAFCYVLTSRQMGKSSLMVRTAQKLRERGILVAVLDLTSIGQNLTPEQWYNGLLTRLGAQTHLEDELDDFWWEHEALGPCQRFITAIREVVLPKLSAPVHPGLGKSLGAESATAPTLVIFVDELDVVRSLTFSTDEFFAAIRECHTRRAEDPAFNHLTFCLLGVATPSDLIRDTRLTPFNIGKRIELRDFEEQEAMALAEALGFPSREANRLLGRIFFWTGGHPYLTQRLCYAVATTPSVAGQRGVDKLCHRMFFSNRARERDDNLLFVRERLLRSEADLINLLRLYRRVHRSTHFVRRMQFRLTLRRIEPVADEETNPLVSVLRLSGVTKVENGRLRVRNPIYWRVFDLAWVEANMPVAELWRRWLIVWGAIKRASKLIAAISLVLILITSAIVVWIQPWRMVRIERSRIARHVSRPKPDVPDRDARASPGMIDLSKYYNAALDRTWHPGVVDNHLAALPRGLQTFAGIEFDVRGVVQLAGRNLWQEGFPQAIAGIPVTNRCVRIHFLHATGWSVSEGIQIGNYAVRYADGRQRFIPILYGQDVRDWRTQGGPASPRELETIAWSQTVQVDSRDAGHHRLFKSTWENPFPDVEILALDYLSTMTDAAPFLIAITADLKY